MSLKSWWNNLWEGNQNVDENGLPRLTETIPMPEVKPCKPEKDISEPVQTLTRLFESNPKRFKFDYNVSYRDTQGVRFHFDNIFAYCSLCCTDSLTDEVWKFNLDLNWDCIRDERFSWKSKFGSHKPYPVLGWRLITKPNWITDHEADYVAEVFVPYFLDRVNRYREIVNYRKERREESHKRKTELDKKKERERLIDIYKGE